MDADKEQCEQVAQLVQDTIAAQKETVTAQFDEHELIVLGNTCNFTSDSKLLIYRRENTDRLFSYANAMRDMKNRVEKDALAYIETYEAESIKEVEKDLVEEVESGTEETIVRATISKKAVVVGFVGGAAIVFFVVVILYLMNGRVRLEDDFEHSYGVKVLGTILQKDVKKKKVFGFIDAFIIKMRHQNKRYFAEDEAIEMTCAGIRIAAKQLGAKKVYVTGAAMAYAEQAVTEKIANALKMDDIEIITGKSILYNAEALEKMVEMGCTVLVEQAGVALYSEIADELETCIHQGVKVIGAVVIA